MYIHTYICTYVMFLNKKPLLIVFSITLYVFIPGTGRVQAYYDLVSDLRYYLSRNYKIWKQQSHLWLSD